MTAPTPEQQALIDEAVKKSKEKLQADTTIVVNVSGNGVMTSPDSQVKIVKGK